MEDKKEYQKNFVAPLSTVREDIGIKKEFGSNQYQENTKGL